MELDLHKCWKLEGGLLICVLEIPHVKVIRAKLYIGCNVGFRTGWFGQKRGGGNFGNK